MKLALIVGGTGMLSGLVTKLAQQYDIVGVIGRNQKRLDSLASTSKAIAPIKTDYADLPAFEEALRAFSEKYGRPDLVVSWIHSTSPKAPLVAARFATNDFYDITGHDGKNANHISRHREKSIRNSGLNYHRIILGQSGGGWLSNQEISDGVYNALTTKADEFVVGRI